VLHRAIPSSEQIERVHLAGLERIVVAEQVGAEVLGPCPSPQFDPGTTDADGVFDIDRIREVDGI
jgi:hypothetical protein